MGQRHHGRPADGTRRFEAATCDRTAPGTATQAAPDARAAHAAGGEAPQRAVHVLLFLLEFTNAQRADLRERYRCLHFFLSRHNGLHLLLMLLNAHYNKPRAGRRGGWVFNALEYRVNASERGLRILVQDALAENLIEQEPRVEGSDRRCRSYRLAPHVIAAWEELVRTGETCVGEVFDTLDHGARANIDYREWEPERPASAQRRELPPHRRRLKDYN